MLLGAGCGTAEPTELVAFPDARHYTTDRYPDVYVPDAALPPVPDVGPDAFVLPACAAGEDAGPCESDDAGPRGRVTVQERFRESRAQGAFEFRTGALSQPAAPLADDGQGCRLHSTACAACTGLGDPVSPGTITVLGPAEPFDVLDGATGNGLSPSDLTELWSPGDSLQISSTGGEFGPFSAMDVLAPGDFITGILVDDETLVRGDGLVLGWPTANNAPTGDEAEVEITIRPANSALRVVCTAPAAEGALELSSDVFGWIAAENDVVDIEYLWRVTREVETAAEPPGRVRIVLEHMTVAESVVLSDFDAPDCPASACDTEPELVGAITLLEKGRDGAETLEVSLFDFRNGALHRDPAPLADDEDGCTLHNTDCAGCPPSGGWLSPGEVTLSRAEGDVTFQPMADGGATFAGGTTDFWTPLQAVRVSAMGDGFGAFDTSEFLAPDAFIFVLADSSELPRSEALFSWAVPEDDELFDESSEVSITIRPQSSGLRVVCSTDASDEELLVPESAFTWLAGESEVVTIEYRWRVTREVDAANGGKVQITLDHQQSARTVLLTE